MDGTGKARVLDTVSTELGITKDALCAFVAVVQRDTFTRMAPCTLPMQVERLLMQSAELLYARPNLNSAVRFMCALRVVREYTRTHRHVEVMTRIEDLAFRITTWLALQGDTLTFDKAELDELTGRGIAIESLQMLRAYP